MIRRPHNPQTIGDEGQTLNIFSEKIGDTSYTWHLTA